VSDDRQDAFTLASKILRDRAQVYVGAQHNELIALGAQMADAAVGNPTIAREMGFIAGLMALEPEAYYEAASLRIQKVRSAVAQAIEKTDALFDGKNGLLRWSPSSLSLREEIDLSRLTALQDLVRQGRFARSSVTEEVHTGILNQARLAAQYLAELKALPDTLAASLPSPQALSNFRDDIRALETQIDDLLSLPSRYQSVDWREFALRRMLESFDADLSLDIEGIRKLGPNDGPVDETLIHTVLAIEIMDRLLSVVTPFGELRSPDVSIRSKPDAKTLDVRLRPIPEKIKGRRTFPARLSVDGDKQYLETCIRSDGGWDHPTWFEQGVSITPSQFKAGWVDVVQVNPVNKVLVETASATPLHQIDGTDLPVYVMHHNVIDQLTPSNHSLYYATAYKTVGTYNVLIEEPSVPPSIGDYVVWGADGSDRLLIANVAPIPIEFTNVPGVYRLLEIQSDLYPNRTAMGGWLEGLANSATPPVATPQLNVWQAVDFGFPLTSFDYVNPATSGIRVNLRLNAPYDSYYSPLFSSAYDRQVSALGTDGVVTSASLSSTIPSTDPYGGRAWSGSAVLYRDRVAAGVTDTVVLDMPVSASYANSLTSALAQRPLRLVDRSGVNPPISVRALESGIRTGHTLEAASADFVSDGDFYVILDTNIDSTVDWTLQMQAGSIQDPDACTTLEVSALSPWRGFTNLALDIAPGDRITLSDGRRITVWATNGHIAYIVPAITLADGETVEGHRTRHSGRGDRFVLLSDTEAETGTWKFESVEFIGGSAYLKVKPLTGIGVDLVDGVYYRGPVALCSDSATTRRFEVVESDSEDLVDLDAIERRFRYQLAKSITQDPGSVIPVRWFLRAGGRVHSASMVGLYNIITTSLNRPLPSSPIDAQFAVRIRSDGYDGLLNLRELWVGLDGDPLGEFPAGGSLVYDIIKKVRIGIPALLLPATTGEVSVRTSTQLRGSVRGPLTTGGSPSYPPYALMEYRLERRITPDLNELFDEIGRARATLGRPRRALASQAGLTLTVNSDRRGGTLTVVGTPGVSRLEGCDVVFSVGDEPDPPIRIQTATIDDDAAPTVVTVTFSRPVPTSLSGTVTLFESVLSNAWREVRSLYRYLESLDQYLGYPVAPSRNRIVDAASRLKSQGHDKAADALLESEFEDWIDPGWLSQGATDLMDRVDDLMSSLSRRRVSPIEGGQ